MHLLRTQPGGFVPDDSIADLGQTPAELVILCSGDSNLTLLAAAAGELGADYPSLRLANPAQLRNHASVDLYVEDVLRHARLILLSLHGGVGYWRYGIERLVELGEAYARTVGYPIQYQWTLLKGINDSVEEMDAILRLFKGKYAVLNLIPYNSLEGDDFQRPDGERIVQMVRYLHSRGVLTKVRNSAGQDIDGGCGQLRARAEVVRSRRQALQAD